jgi:hypothetical protein
MVNTGYREEVFNVLLALLLHQRGVVTAPEQSLRQAIQGRRRIPDVQVSFQGLRTVIEGEVDDQPQAQERALQEAQERVTRGIAHIGVAVVYPAALRKVSFPSVMDSLAHSTFRIAVCSEAGETGWTEGSLDYLAELLRRTFHQLVKEDVVTKAVEILDGGIAEFARLTFTSRATTQRAAQILGIGEPPRRTRKQQEEED